MKKAFLYAMTLISIIMVFPLSAFAFECDAMDTVEYREVDGKKYVTVDGASYRYLTADDFHPVEDMEVVNALEASTFTANASAALPVPPTYTYNLANGTYYGSVNLSNGGQWSPLIKRDVPKRYTNFRVTSPNSAMISMGVFYYNSFEKKWYGEPITDEKFTIDVRQFRFGSMGEAAEGLRILFFDYETSTQSFSYSLTDTNILA